ncbi:aminotransferase class I/II-fold pyridoxal phosphate-dependent enzyme [Aggregicoccus sp. 17bor-14]|uniref:aminotransferase class I/II-fold pyridoxal phosphate-dependent enzyme n=1 Tax=Myxococcaceae TaxID=31 RepID=UPI00129C5A3E|nr:MULTISPECIES: aminotransferase class I/II-fold pyridoxal phosphate-dependent enzyme [Myxococcaceae]MBF5043675.1 aminotransferase class I/II-fold pyridoxal phosphate-dependent enzyme [Simulacricoccus sp. 17bor-14]MRI89433.1 aminotransferase class I/II-fold pyridoxal phosphate-dependent enzyme [Aggregicoccus sp. 17bor-14]
MRIPDFKLERYFAKWEFSAPYLLCSSDIEGWRMADLLALADDDARSRWEALTLGYTESTGLPALREAIAGLYAGVAPEEVLTFGGAQEALFVLLNVLLGPGDHALVTWPGYQSLYEVARATGADVALLRLRPEDGWQLDVEALERALKPNTRCVVVNFPHNPTGALPPRAAFEALGALCAARGIVLLSDEVYRLLEYAPADRLPAAVELPGRGVSLGVMSKAFGLAGLRVGWLALKDAGLRARIAAFKDYTTICNSAPSEVLALIALRAKEQVLARSRALLEGNLGLLDAFFARHAERFGWVRPRAGSVAFPRLLQGGPVDRFCQRLVEQEGVLLLPGSVYDFPGDHFRLGFGRSSLPEALERLERFVASSTPA